MHCIVTISSWLFIVSRYLPKLVRCIMYRISSSSSVSTSNKFRFFLGWFCRRLNTSMEAALNLGLTSELLVDQWFFSINYFLSVHCLGLCLLFLNQYSIIAFLSYFSILYCCMVSHQTGNSEKAVEVRMNGINRSPYRFVLPPASIEQYIKHLGDRLYGHQVPRRWFFGDVQRVCLLHIGFLRSTAKETK